MALKRIEKRKEKRKKILMSVFMAGLMVLSVAGIVVGNYTSGGSQTVEQKGLVFELEQDGYHTEIQGREIVFYTLPSGVESIEAPEDLGLKILDSQSLIYTFDPGLDPASLQMVDLSRFDFARHIPRQALNGVSRPNPGYTLPVYTCENATSETKVIYFNSSTETSVVQRGNCFVLNGEETGFARLRDLLLYKVYGIL